MTVQEPADVLLIGAGAAGAAVAKRLSDHGASVICLEQGDWVDRDMVPKKHLDWEVRGRRFWSANPNVRRWPADYPVASHGDDPIDIYMYNAVGGSTIGFAANYWRLNPSDFRLRSLDGVAVDWPLTYQELEPYYDINEREIGVAGLAGDPCGPPRTPTLLPPLPIGRAGSILAQGFDKLGWYWWPTEAAIATVPMDDRLDCDFRGYCPFGCPRGAMSTADVTYWPKALKNGVDLRTRSRVREIALDGRGRAQGALYYDAAGQLREVRARVVVLSASGIGTPRLLLLNRSSAHPDGLANSSGMVGKNLMVHVQSFAVGRFDDPVEAWRGTWGGSVSTRHHYETDPARDYLRGFIISGAMGWSPLNLASQIAPWGQQHHATMDRYLNHEIVLYLCGDDLPEPENRVELDWTNLDGFGMPGAQTYYRLGENSKKLGADMLAKAHATLEASGASSVRDFGLSPIWGWHLMGTARMGDDPATSVVDGHNRAHDVPNLFIVDGSSLPTGGGVNPTSTIQALAVRCAEYIWDQRRGW